MAARPPDRKKKKGSSSRYESSSDASINDIDKSVKLIEIDGSVLEGVRTCTLCTIIGHCVFVCIRVARYFEILLL